MFMFGLRGGMRGGEWCGADQRVQPCSRLSVTCTAEYAAAVDGCRLKKDAALFGLYRLISLPGGSRGTHTMKNVSHWQVSQSSFEDDTVRGATKVLGQAVHLWCIGLKNNSWTAVSFKRVTHIILHASARALFCPDQNRMFRHDT